MSPAWIEKNGTDEVRLAMFPTLLDAEYLVNRIGVVWHYSELWITDQRGNVVMRKTNAD